jgi:hypothetical protein
MASNLHDTLEALRAHESELRQMGVSHAAVFGSVARGEARPDSDVDVLVDIDESRPIGVFAYARMALRIGDILHGTADVVERAALKPLLRESILHDAIRAF